MPANEFSYQGSGKDLSADEKGVGYGLFETAKYVAGVLAIAGLGSIAAARTAHMGTADRATALAAGYRLAFLVAAGIAVLGGLVTVLLGDARKGSAVMGQAGSPVPGPSGRR